MNFKNVNSVEINKENYDILVNNVELYNFDNVKTYNENIIEFWDNLSISTDIFF
jgi:hypothetical protein